MTAFRFRRGQPWFAFLIRLMVAEPPPGAIFTYGHTIWAPGPLDAGLFEHESTHTRQQGRFPFVWWARWLTSRRFRLEQEAAAYAAQFLCIQNRTPRRVHLRALYALAENLAGPMYGGLCTEREARDRIFPFWH